MNAVPVNIQLSWGALEGLHWSQPGAPKVLCLHGWLDNAASFVPLAPFLEDFDLLALDFAGHGFSSHRPESSRYYFTDYLFDVDAAMHKLGWEQCHLLGHSLGGGVASCLAAAMPERVNRLVLLDSLGMLTLPADQAARQLHLSMMSVRKARSFLRPYESVEDAMQARQRKSPLSDDAARLLCQRSLEHTGDYYQWCTDPNLNWRSPQLPGDEQALDLLAAIRAPTLVITSPELISYFGEDMANRRISAISNCKHVSNDGHHHFHMEQAQQVAAHIIEFLQHDQSQGANHVDS
ncbi:MAG: alpha/beta hydrolase [Xanthomonadales bacterium]|nr:alpha/beta hydrolase [Xanthomonadales bacterium]MDH4020363.1 alpha/beta hydrolase [Xanthomonadales bacterium]